MARASRLRSPALTPRAMRSRLGLIELWCARGLEAIDDQILSGIKLLPIFGSMTVQLGQWISRFTVGAGRHGQGSRGLTATAQPVSRRRPPVVSAAASEQSLGRDPCAVTQARELGPDHVFGDPPPARRRIEAAIGAGE